MKYLQRPLVEVSFGEAILVAGDSEYVSTVIDKVTPSRTLVILMFACNP
jgi:hypothetical protein